MHVATAPSPRGLFVAPHIQDSTSALIPLRSYFLGPKVTVGISHDQILRGHTSVKHIVMSELVSTVCSACLLYCKQD